MEDALMETDGDEVLLGDPMDEKEYEKEDDEEDEEVRMMRAHQDEPAPSHEYDEEGFYEVEEGDVDDGSGLFFAQGEEEEEMDVR